MALLQNYNIQTKHMMFYNWTLITWLRQEFKSKVQDYFRLV